MREPRVAEKGVGGCCSLSSHRSQNFGSNDLGELAFALSHEVSLSNDSRDILESRSRSDMLVSLDGMTEIALRGDSFLLLLSLPCSGSGIENSTDGRLVRPLVGPRMVPPVRHFSVRETLWTAAGYTGGLFWKPSGV